LRVLRVVGGPERLDARDNRIILRGRRHWGEDHKQTDGDQFPIRHRFPLDIPAIMRRGFENFNSPAAPTARALP
jgi:hypothetical protein